MEEIIQILKTACIEISDMMRNTDPLALSKLTDNSNIWQNDYSYS